MGNYSFEQALAASLEYFDGDELAADVFLGKYALRDEQGNLLECDPSQMHRRLAKEFARIETKYPNPMSEKEIFGLLDRFKYIVPQGSPMSAIGNPYKLQSLSNCFVVDKVHDSIGGILYADQELAQIMKRRGGVGIDISSIRPQGVATANAAGTTDGIATFMERFSSTCRSIAQGGRRGALMVTISCFVGNTLILTENGWEDIKSIVENRFVGSVWTHEGFKQIDDWQSLGERDVYEIECENGKKITVTSDHEFVVKNFKTGEEYLKKICDVEPEEEELVFYDVQF